MVLTWFGNNDIPPPTLAYVASEVIAHVMGTGPGGVLVEAFVTALLAKIATRHDGRALLRDFLDSVDTAWANTPIDRDHLKRLIKQVSV
jgi:hypothetical protein